MKIEYLRVGEIYRLDESLLSVLKTGTHVAVFQKLNPDLSEWKGRSMLMEDSGKRILCRKIHKLVLVTFAGPI